MDTPEELMEANAMRILEEIVEQVVDEILPGEWIAPERVADISLRRIDPTNSTPPISRLGAFYTLRKIAARLLKGRYKPQDKQMPLGDIATGKID